MVILPVTSFHLYHLVRSFRDLLEEKEMKHIVSSMVGHQTRLVVSIGYGYQGVAGRLVEPLMSPKDSEENFVLLWHLNV